MSNLNTRISAYWQAPGFSTLQFYGIILSPSFTPIHSREARHTDSGRTRPHRLPPLQIRYAPLECYTTRLTAALFYSLQED